MDIPRDLRRKMIMKLIEALKESPSFSNISDTQLNEAVLNSEHQTYQQSSNRDEYMAHINEKLRKISQASHSKLEPLQPEARQKPIYENERSKMGSNGYDSNRGKIISGNIPPHVKVSQGYSQDTMPQMSSATRKLDVLSPALETNTRVYGIHYQPPEPSADHSSEMKIKGKIGFTPSEFSTVDQPYFNIQVAKNPHGYPQNMRSESYTPQPPRVVIKPTNAVYTASQPYGAYYTGRQAPVTTAVKTQENPMAYQRPPFGDDISQHVAMPTTGQSIDLRASKVKLASLEHQGQVDYSQSDQLGRFSQSYFTSSQDQGMFQHSNNRSPQPFYGSDPKPFQVSVGESNGQRKMAGMFTSPNGKFKTDMYSEKFGLQPVKRGNITSQLPDIDPDSRLSRSQSYRSDSDQDGGGYLEKPPKPLSMQGKTTQFEYSYSSGNPANKSYVGNINPGLLNHTSKMPPDDIKGYSKAERPTADATSYNIKVFEDKGIKPFNDKRSEELFKSFSEEFMKNTKKSPTAQMFGMVDSTERNEEHLEKLSETVESDDLDDQIPEKLQNFLDTNHLSLKEVADTELWKALFTRAFSRLPEFEGEHLPFKAKLMAQNDFIEFPFCDEADLKKFIDYMDSKKPVGSLKISKEDYLDYIDKAIEAFSEKKEGGIGQNGFCGSNE